MIETEHTRQESVVTEGYMIGTLIYVCTCGHWSFNPADWHWRDPATITGQEIFAVYRHYHPTPNFVMSERQWQEYNEAFEQDRLDQIAIWEAKHGRPFPTAKPQEVKAHQPKKKPSQHKKMRITTPLVNQWRAK